MEVLTASDARRAIRALSRRVLGVRSATKAAGDPFKRYRSPAKTLLVRGPTPVHDPLLDDDPRLVVLVPRLDVGRMSGGPNTILQVTARLVSLGIRVRYVSAFGTVAPSESAVMDHLRTITGIDPEPGAIAVVDAGARGATFGVGRQDVLFATWWPTAHVANAALKLTDATEFLYLVQDFEPGFYAWSTKFALAAATYAMPMRAVVNEPVVLEYLRGSGWLHGSNARSAIAFMPAVDRAVFRPRGRAVARRPFRLLFYARPRSSRNLFDLGLEALRVAVSAGVFDGAAWEFLAVGQPVPDLPLSAGHSLKAVPWMAYTDYGRFLGESDLLLSLMLSPHTSYPPLEMAATGGLVVTNTFAGKTEAAMGAISPSIRAVEPELEALVGAIRAAVKEIECGHRPAATTSLPETWDAALETVVPWVRDAVTSIRGGTSPRR